MTLMTWCFVTAPDTRLGSRLYDVADLDEKTAVKVLQHQEKAGSGRLDLPPRLLRLSAYCGIRLGPTGVELEAGTLEPDQDAELLACVERWLAEGATWYGWAALDTELALLRQRALLSGQRLPALWAEVPQRAWGEVLQPGRPTDDRALDQTVRLLGLPGLFDSVAGPEGPAGPLAWAERRSVNLFLLTLRILVSSGQLAPATAALGAAGLRERLSSGAAPARQALLDDWSR